MVWFFRQMFYKLALQNSKNQPTVQFLPPCSGLRNGIFHR
jgi:hypothetical protein